MAYMGLKCSAWIWDLIRRDQCLMYIDSDQFSAKTTRTVCKGILLFVSYTFKAIDLPESVLEVFSIFRHCIF